MQQLPEMLRAELAEGEPPSGGLDFDSAIFRWVSEEEWKSRRLEVERADRTAYLHMTEKQMERGCRSYVFKEKWGQRQVICFGFPLHKPAGRRELISGALREQLLFYIGYSRSETLDYGRPGY
jgi:hypothetical protein